MLGQMFLCVLAVVMLALILLAVFVALDEYRRGQREDRREELRARREDERCALELAQARRMEREAARKEAQSNGTVVTVANEAKPMTLPVAVPMPPIEAD